MSGKRGKKREQQKSNKDKNKSDNNKRQEAEQEEQENQTTSTHTNKNSQYLDVFCEDGHVLFIKGDAFVSFGLGQVDGGCAV